MERLVHSIVAAESIDRPEGATVGDETNGTERAQHDVPGPDLWTSTGAPLVLHVIPTPLARGGQREARALADALDRPGVRTHRVLCIFDGPDEVRTDLSLHIADGDQPGVGFNIRAVPALRSALKRLNPVAVVAHGGEPLKYLVPAMIGHPRPLAYYAIGTYGAAADHRLQVQIWRTLLRRVDAVAAEGTEVEDELVDLLGVPSTKVTMTPNGRDPDVFQRRSDGREDDRCVVTYVGALTEGKRPLHFVKAITGLRARGVDCRAILIGDGPLRDQVEGPAKAADIELLGSRSDVAELLGRSDVMVFPSRPQGEGMPGVLIEGGLCGLPIVATDVEGVRTVIDDGVTGYIVGVDDLDAMIDALTRLVEDDDLRHTMGEAARTRCQQEFSIEAVAALWLEMLTPLLPPGLGTPIG